MEQQLVSWVAIGVIGGGTAGVLFSLRQSNSRHHWTSWCIWDEFDGSAVAVFLKKVSS
jgi:hypothetical protein